MKRLLIIIIVYFGTMNAMDKPVKAIIHSIYNKMEDYRINYRITGEKLEVN
jgi:hypothetical protein